MKYIAQFLVAGLLMFPAFARSGGGFRGGGFHGAVGGGFHGMAGGMRGARGGGFGRGGYGRGGFGGYGRGGFGGFNHGFHNHFRHNRFGFGLQFFPGFYSYPYYGLGFWDYGMDSGYPYYDTGYSNPSYDYGYQPPVVIYQNSPSYNYTPPPETVHPEMRDYETAPSGPSTSTIRPAGEPPIYLFAVKGQDNILAGITYWVEGNTLQYINLQHVQKRIPLSSLDRTLTYRLNHERNMDLRLPPA